MYLCVVKYHTFLYGKYADTLQSSTFISPYVYVSTYLRMRNVLVPQPPTTRGPTYSRTEQQLHMYVAHLGKDLADFGRCLGWFRSSWRPASMNRRNSWQSCCLLGAQEERACIGYCAQCSYNIGTIHTYIRMDEGYSYTYSRYTYILYIGTYL